jgi:hypothetical protein
MRPLLVFLLALLIAAPARAGTYEHLSLPGTDGWSGAVWAPRGYVSTGLEGAGEPWAGFFVRSPFDPGDRAEWSYAAPPDTTITGWAFERQVAGIAGGDWNTTFAAEADGRSRLVAYDVPSVNRSWERLAAGGLAATRLVARLICGGPGPCYGAGGATTLRLRAATVTLHDGHAPVVSAVQGDLATETVLAGTAQLSFSASDAGGGVYRALVLADGTVQGRAVVDADGGRCRSVGGPYQFAFRVPCPRATSATVALDTQALADGRHVVEVAVEDVAGNRTTVYGPATKTVANHPPSPPAPSPPAPVPPGGAPGPAAPPLVRPAVVTAWLERRGRRWRVVTAGYGERVRLRGRVTDPSGRPLADVPLAIAEQVSDGRRSWTPLTGVRTRGDGRFTAFTRVGPSRRLRIAAADGAAAPALTVRVRAPLTVRAARRGNGAVVRGRLRGGHVPPGGALVEIQVRAGRRWVTRLVARTFRTGRFFGRLDLVPSGGVAIRARVPRQPGLPFAAGLARAGQPSA